MQFQLAHYEHSNQGTGTQAIRWREAWRQNLAEISQEYFIEARLLEQYEVHNAQMNTTAQDMLWGKASKWLNNLEWLETARSTFADFYTKILE